jgi:rod shape determining protein RodA
VATLSTPRLQSNPQNVLRTIASYDWWLMLSTAILILFGLMSLYSINYDVPGPYFKRQLLNLGVGLVPFLIFLVVKPATWKKMAPILYAFCLGLLAMVLVMGEKKGGDAQRWIEIGPMQFQPSEMAKLLLVLTLAAFWATRQETAKKLSTFLLSFAHVAIPMLMIYKQPHLGSTLVVFATWLAVSLAMGARPRFIGLSIILGIMGLVAAYFIPGVLDDYQRSRVHGLISPDAKSTGFQVDHGLTAIGNGGVTGQGFLKGELKAREYVPAQQTDFIVTVLGEEGGLVGIALLIITYGVFFFRIWWIMLRAEDSFHKGALAGVLAVLAFHTIVNLGMVFKLLPVVGLWLPFLSYGGTAMWLCVACVALVLNIKAREDTGKF